MRFFSDAPPVNRRTLLPLAVLASGLLWGLDGLIIGENRLTVTLLAVWAAYMLWRFGGRRRTGRPPEEGTPA